MRIVEGIRWRWRKLRDPDPTLKLHIRGPEDIVEFLNDPRARLRVKVVEITATPWYRIRLGWTGRLGPLYNVKSSSVEFAKGRAFGRVELDRRTEAIHVVRAMYSIFYPARAVATGLISPRIGLRAGAPTDLAWSLGGGLRPVANDTVREVDQMDFDLIAGNGEVRSTDRLTQELTLVERAAGPAIEINPQVHCPLSRRHPHPKTVSGKALVRGDRFLVEASDGRTLIDEPLAGSLGQANLRKLRAVSNIDASALPTDSVCATRLAELAAHGQPVHSAAADMPLHADLNRLVTAGWSPLPLLDHMNRAMAQVRAVMTHHTRFGVDQRWPTVTALLVTRRPELLAGIVQQLAAQTYPHMEVVLVCHGFEPDMSQWAAELRDCIGSIVRVEQHLTFGDALAAGTDAASGQLITKIDDDDLYGPDHVADVVTAWMYSAAQLVGRKMALVRDVGRDELLVRRLFHESYGPKVTGGSLMISKADLIAIGGWRPIARGIEGGLRTRLDDAGALHYACSGPGYVYQRYPDINHTWPVEMDWFQEDRFHEATVPGLPPAALGILDDAMLEHYATSIHADPAGRRVDAVTPTANDGTFDEL